PILHGILSVFLQISRRGLFNVSNLFETLRRLLLQTAEKFQQIAYVGTSLVKVKRVRPSYYPALCLNLSRCAVDPYDAVEVPLQIVAGQFDLNVGQAVVTNPTRQSLRQAVVHPFSEIRVFDSIRGSDRMIESQSCARLLQQILIQVFAFEFRPQIMRQIVRHEIMSIGTVRAEAMNF